MPQTAAEPAKPFAQDDADPGPAALGIDPRAEEAHWRRHWEHEPCRRPGLDWEDYAPAYCVGFVGWAQYGGRYEDAEISLCANWERLRAGSRLELPLARAAMRAAWDRLEQLQQQRARPPAPGKRHGAKVRRASLAPVEREAEALA